MLFLDPAHLPKGPLMAVDPGSRTLGVAVCNAARTVVTPLTTIQRTKFTQDSEALLKLYDERGCAGLVVGLPLHMDGGDGRRAQSSRSFVTNLLRLRDLPVVYQDERLSTFEASERLLQAGVRHADLKDMIDAEAAADILRGALDAIARGGTDS
ncbi:Holliday junction resolvase RuvX [Alkalicaulis satelles]|uniref:Putative pre-16S rRNA nuclease n=1 Tax=Alkalicaulis satelles TaxID=2609175 RepID=A0A5M6ZI36_9PROT|nr:Holliday junction resolvase RuvX [Alkalicaulis satelles]KAA5804492.1 Holliday junction resolvase RuvX [Alkalicaulis satelles]